MTKKRTAILISGRGANMAALIEAAKSPDYPAQISLVISNVETAAGLTRAHANNIPALVIDHRQFGKDRQAFEAAIQDQLERHDIEIVCLAGFLRLFTPWLVSRWSGRMINMHPALLPSFKGMHACEQALAAGVKIHGASVHFVVPEVDSGPIVAQAAVPVLDNDTADTLAARVLAAELRLYPMALGLVASSKAQLIGDQVRNAVAVKSDADFFVPGLK